MKRRNWFFRIFFYAASMLILALAITLNTKTGLGVSPIVSVAFSVSRVFDLNFGNMTLVLYVIFVIVELVIRGKNRRWYDLLQIVVSLIFTRFMNLFDAWISFPYEGFLPRILLLIVAIVLTGIGSAMSLNMRLVPNPGDGIVGTVADVCHMKVGFTKNMIDLSCITLTFFIGLISGHFLVGIGIGTVCAVIGVGRVVALFNLLCKDRMDRLIGLAKEEEKN